MPRLGSLKKDDVLLPIDTIEEKQKKIEFKSYCKKKTLEK
jgi:hypothetical protein